MKYELNLPKIIATAHLNSTKRISKFFLGVDKKMLRVQFIFWDIQYGDHQRFCT
jgi:hypothetical protein